MPRDPVVPFPHTRNGASVTLPAGWTWEPLAAETTCRTLVTISRSAPGQAHNKRLTAGPDAAGRWPKPESAPRYNETEGIVVDAPGAEGFAATLRGLGITDAVIVGYPHGARPGDRYRIVSENRLRVLLGMAPVPRGKSGDPPLGVFIDAGGVRYICRVSENFANSAIKLFDFDVKDGQTYPDDWRRRSGADWWAAMVAVEPSLAGVERLQLGSNSARFVGPDGQPLFPEKRGQIHVYVWSEGFAPGHAWTKAS